MRIGKLLVLAIVLAAPFITGCTHEKETTHNPFTGTDKTVDTVHGN